MTEIIYPYHAASRVLKWFFRIMNVISKQATKGIWCKWDRLEIEDRYVSADKHFFDPDLLTHQTLNFHR